MTQQHGQKQYIQSVQQLISSSTTTTIKITPNVLHNRSEQSNLSSTSSINPLPQSSHGRVTNAHSHSVLRDSKLTSNSSKTSSTVSKESTTHSQRENNSTSIGSTRLNERSTAPLAEHQSNWTVRSTIVTAYTQGVEELTGPTLVMKVISEASATSSSDIPLKTTIKEIEGNGTSCSKCCTIIIIINE